MLEMPVRGDGLRGLGAERVSTTAGGTKKAQTGEVKSTLLSKR